MTVVSLKEMDDLVQFHPPHLESLERLYLTHLTEIDERMIARIGRDLTAGKWDGAMPVPPDDHHWRGMLPFHGRGGGILICFAERNQSGKVPDRGVYVFGNPNVSETSVNDEVRSVRSQLSHALDQKGVKAGKRVVGIIAWTAVASAASIALLIVVLYMNSHTNIAIH